jgi:hypothetical protein
MGEVTQSLPIAVDDHADPFGDDRLGEESGAIRDNGIESRLHLSLCMHSIS